VHAESGDWVLLPAERLLRVRQLLHLQPDRHPRLPVRHMPESFGGCAIEEARLVFGRDMGLLNPDLIGEVVISPKHGVVMLARLNGIQRSEGRRPLDKNCCHMRFEVSLCGVDSSIVTSRATRYLQLFLGFLT
jgi:hypothetical protein